MGRKSKNGSQIERVLKFVIKEEYITWPYISRKLQIGCIGAQKVIKQLEQMGYIEKADSTKKRVLKHKLLN